MIFASIRKSRVLMRIGKRHSPSQCPDQFAREFVQDLRGKGPSRYEQTEQDILALFRADRGLQQVARRHNITTHEVLEWFQNLSRRGYATSVKGHYLPASALAFGFTLEYVAAQARAEMPWGAISERLYRYFLNNEVGCVSGENGLPLPETAGQQAGTRVDMTPRNERIRANLNKCLNELAEGINKKQFEVVIDHFHLKSELDRPRIPDKFANS